MNQKQWLWVSVGLIVWMLLVYAMLNAIWPQAVVVVTPTTTTTTTTMVTEIGDAVAISADLFMIVMRDSIRIFGNENTWSERYLDAELIEMGVATCLRKPIDLLDLTGEFSREQADIVMFDIFLSASDTYLCP